MFQIQHSTDDYLDLYRDILKCYEHLNLKLQISYSENTLDMDLMERCYKQIEMLLNFELVSQQQDELNLDICTSLLLIQQQLKQLIETPQSLQSTELKQLIEKPQNLQTTVEKKLINATVPRIKGLAEVAGLDEIKKMLVTIILLPMYQPQLYVNQRVCNSILFYGPPGTGKTRLANGIAAEASATFFSMNCSDILSHYVGETEKTVKEVFDTLKNEQNCAVLFLDELDGLCQRRQSGDSEWSRRLKTELMCQLSNFEDCSNKYLICATNCPWDLDTAIIRRFQRRIYVPLPNMEERMDLIKFLTKDTPIEISAEVLSLISEKTKGYSGSDITDVIRNAMNMPIYELTNTQLWEHIGDNKYKAAGHCYNKQNLILSSISQMPPGSVQIRPFEVFDIMKALETIKPTVPINELIKYEEFAKTV